MSYNQILKGAEAMADAKETVKQQLQMGENLLKMFSSDFSDADGLVQPVEGGCHLIWILGHLATTQDWAVSKLTGQPNRVPQKLIDLFKGGSKVAADAKRYPPRAEVEDLFRQTQAATIKALDVFDEKRWSDPSPDGVPREYFPTAGSLWGMMGTHTFWHVGQLTDIRRRLGKPQRLTE